MATDVLAAVLANSRGAGDTIHVLIGQPSTYTALLEAAIGCAEVQLRMTLAGSVPRQRPSRVPLSVRGAVPSDAQPQRPVRLRSCAGLYRSARR